MSSSPSSPKNDRTKPRREQRSTSNRNGSGRSRSAGPTPRSESMAETVLSNAKRFKSSKKHAKGDRASPIPTTLPNCVLQPPPPYPTNGLSAGTTTFTNTTAGYTPAHPIRPEPTKSFTNLSPSTNFHPFNSPFPLFRSITEHFQSSNSTISAATSTTTTDPDSFSKPATSLSIRSRSTGSESDGHVSPATTQLPPSIMFNLKHPIACIHTTTSLPAYKPKYFVLYPYRKTMLSLLCRVELRPTDSFSPFSAPADRLQVYACYQQHWNPKYNIPVLTIVACCNTHIAPPILTRTEPNIFNIRIMATTGEEQGFADFELPIYTTLQRAAHSVFIATGPHNAFPDSLTSYFIGSAIDRSILTWVKIWHLSPYGCHNLHGRGLLQPMRAYPLAEVHLLGLTGQRKMPYRLQQHDLFTSLASVLDPIDLGNCGYKKFPSTSKPTVPIEMAMITKLRARAFPRPVVTDPWYYERGQIQKTTQAPSSRMAEFDPEYYPPPYGHSLLSAEFPDPVVFKPGESAYRFPILHHMTTIDEMLQDCLAREPHSHPISTLMKYYSFHRDDLDPRCLNTSFVKFLENKGLHNKTSNPTCQYLLFSHGYNTGSRYLIHKTWIHITSHPLIANVDAESMVRIN